MPIQTLGRASQGMGWSWSQCIKSHHAQTFSGKGIPSQGLESGGRLERYRIQASWSPVWSFWSQWWFGVPWHMLVLFHCVLSSTKSLQPSTRRFWSPLCFHLLTRFMDFLISFSSRTLAPGCPLCQNHFQVVCWPRYHCAWLASQHAWLEPYMEFRGYFQQKDLKQPIQQSRRA